MRVCLGKGGHQLPGRPSPPAVTHPSLIGEGRLGRESGGAISSSCLVPLAAPESPEGGGDWLLGFTQC